MDLLSQASDRSRELIRLGWGMMRVSRKGGTLVFCLLSALAAGETTPAAAQERLGLPNLRLGDEQDREGPINPVQLNRGARRQQDAAGQQPAAPQPFGARRVPAVEPVGQNVQPVEPQEPLQPEDEPAAAAPEDDPFAAPGVRIGTLLLRGSLDVDGGYDSNPLRLARESGSAFTQVGGTATLTSDWSRHQLEARLDGNYTNYFDLEEANAPVINGELRGRLDVRENIELDGLLGVALATLDPGDADTPQGLADRPLFTEFRGLAGATYRAGKWSLRAGGRVEHETFEDGKLIGGGVFDNSDRINTTYALDLRSTYAVSPKLEAFTEASIDTRKYDRELDRNGLERDSTGQSVATGLRYSPTALVDLEVSGGYRWRQYKDDDLPDLSGFTADASLVWRATPLTAVTLTVGTLFDDTTLVDASGSVSRFVRGEVTHDLRRFLQLTAAASAERAEFTGINREDTLYTAEVGVEWKFNRRFGVRGRVAHELQESSVPGADYTATLYQLGIRFRY